MAQHEDSESRFDPMHRMVGAVILVTLAVILVPLVLQQREFLADPDSASVSPSASVSASLGARNAERSATKIVVTPVTGLGINDDASVSDDAAGSQAEQPLATASLPQRVSPVSPIAASPAKPVAQPTPKKTVSPVVATVSSAKPQDPPTTAASQPDHGWVVQLGTYANPKNADRMRAKLKQLGYVVSMESIQLRNGKATRVRVGPYAKKNEALNKQTQLQKQVGLNGVVLAYP